MATEAAWLNGNRLTERRKRKCALTSTGLLMEGLSRVAPEESVASGLLVIRGKARHPIAKLDWKARGLSSCHLEFPCPHGCKCCLVDRSVDRLYHSPSDHFAAGRDRNEQIQVTLYSCLPSFLRIRRQRHMYVGHNFQLAGVLSFHRELLGVGNFGVLAFLARRTRLGLKAVSHLQLRCHRRVPGPPELILFCSLHRRPKQSRKPAQGFRTGNRPVPPHYNPHDHSSLNLLRRCLWRISGISALNHFEA